MNFPPNIHRDEHARRLSASSASPAQMDPCDRLRRFGPIRPMPTPRSLIERILFS